MPSPQVTQKQIATASVTPQPRIFDEIKGKAREARVFFYFLHANVPVSMPHALGRKPTSFRVVTSSAPLSTVIHCNTTNASATVTSGASGANNGYFGGIGEGPVYVGMSVTGSGIPAATTVSAKASDLSITISNPATATVTLPSTVALTFSGSGQVPPGTIYAPVAGGAGASAATDSAYTMTSNYLVLACSTGNTWAEVLVS